MATATPMTKRLLRSVCLAVLVSGAWPALRAAEPVVPSDPAILAYCRFYDAPDVCRRLSEWSASLAGAESPLGRIAWRSALHGLLGDRQQALLQPDRPFTFAAVRGADGPMRWVCVLSDVASPRYLELCGNTVGMRTRVLQGGAFALMASDPDQPMLGDALTSSLLALHEAVHPTDLCVFLRGEYIQAALGEFDTLWYRATPALGISAQQADGIRKALPLAETLASQVAWVCALVGEANASPRLILNIQSVEGSDLAALFSSPVEQSNALPRFLPCRGWCVAALCFQGRFVSDFCNRLFEAAWADKPHAAKAWRGRADRWLMATGPSVVELGSANTQRALALLTPIDRRGIVRQVAEVLAHSRSTSGLSVAPAPPAPASPGQRAAQPIGYGAGGAIEGFEVLTYSERATNEAAPAAAEAPAALTYLGNTVALAIPGSGIEELIRRMILIEKPGAALLSQRVYLAGGALYADVRAPGSSGPWRRGATAAVMLRWADGSAQLAVGRAAGGQ